MNPSVRLASAALLAALAGAACSGTTRETAVVAAAPPPRAEAGRPPAAEVKTDSTPRRYTEADVRFMQGMIAHHAQALAMTALVPARSARDDIRLLAERIEVSQRAEIAMMRHWLEARHEEAPNEDAHAEHHEHHEAAGQPMLMPGMLTAEELARLAGATGAEFDRLFLSFMIRHHEGALEMVGTLFASQGAAQEPETFRFASDVDADQRAEIARMRRMLDARPSSAPRP
ncbi:MAG TPA: DUF305 domain-containing protein [Longimicrobiales bacterium]|nr:DUF305 domain-containing protein [Longimicrobiales bacterium]